MRQSLPFSLSSYQPPCARLFQWLPISLSQCSVWELRSEAPREESTEAAVLLSTSLLTELTSFFPPSPLLPTSNPALMSQTWLKAPICSQAHRSVKSSCCLFSKLLSELLSQESYQNSSCDTKQNKYIVI